eukprot:g28206.t1
MSQGLDYLRSLTRSSSFAMCCLGSAVQSRALDLACLGSAIQSRALDLVCLGSAVQSRALPWSVWWCCGVPSKVSFRVFNFSADGQCALIISVKTSVKSNDSFSMMYRARLSTTCVPGTITLNNITGNIKLICR